MLPIILAIRDEEDRNFVSGIYEDYGKQLYKTAFSILNSNEDAEDCVHDVIVALIDNLEKIRTFESNHQIKYIIKCCRNIALNRYRANSVKSSSEFSTSYSEEEGEMDIPDDNFEGRWWIYKLNDDNPYPTLSDHFNNSWKVDDSDDNNPWISAKGFDEYWRDRVAHQDFTTGQLLADDKPEGLYNFEVGDVIMVMENGIGTHAMIITRAPEDYRNEDEVLYLSGHTNFRMDESFRDILEDMNTNTVFRFYNFHDIKG